MDFKGLWEVIKFKAKRFWKKFKKLVKKYIRLLVKHTKAGDYSILIYSIFTVIAVILLFVLFGKIFSLNDNDKKDKKNTTEYSTPFDATEDPEIAAQKAMVEQAKQIYADPNNQKFLILVNETNAVPDSYAFEHYTLNCGLDIDKAIYDDLLTMLSECNTAGYEYNVINAYLSKADQQENYDSAKQRYIDDGLLEEEAAVKAAADVGGTPGYNEHETGLALDLTNVDIFDYGAYNANDKINQWFQNNSYKYGFIQRYPANKTSITGVGNQLWQYRYVGKEAAKFMKSNNLSLEEFHQLVNQPSVTTESTTEAPMSPMDEDFDLFNN